ncbi:GNAT family N-acetyltransferase [Desmospora activa]|uniref:Ribosomal protein S18 acetylase RimI-like enzyme n=1 Tax=Desmospora activa DSM 45169 TaxID=1121389 RepID=A0A2T4Z4N6_9BACL|nr:GNAT family N-acetyltransferase [Desmospora activa]PTM56835.1 ribosomal protein S18 acetylase RimI-like enzyme [Desmospora activa DSM 45169]
MLSNNVQIRPIRETDLLGVQKVAHTTWFNTYNKILPEESIQKFLSHAYSLDHLKKSWEEDIKKTPRQFYVIADKDSIIGYGQLTERAPAEYELTRIYILPEFQGKGLGKRLLNQLIDTIHPLQRMFAWVEKENSVGRTFYQSMNFHVEKELQDNFFGTITTLLQYARK